MAEADLLGRTALHYAAIAGHYDAVELLLYLGAPLDVARTPSPVHWAFSGGHDRLAMLLLQRKADPNAAGGTPGTTLLHEAVFNGLEGTVSLLLIRGPDIDARDAHSRDSTALHHAARGARTTLVPLLLNAGADVHARILESEATALHLAIFPARNLGIVRLLLDHNADIHAEFEDSYTDDGSWPMTVTPSRLASKTGCLDIHELLLARGVDPKRKGHVLEGHQRIPID